MLTGYLHGGGWFPIAVVISVTGWAFGAGRLPRAQTLSLRNRDYIKAARAIGERPRRIVTVELVRSTSGRSSSPGSSSSPSPSRSSPKPGCRSSAWAR
ncbi:hypothetical protein ACU686_01095 [Yinghuangia aomiensis]